MGTFSLIRGMLRRMNNAPHAILVIANIRLMVCIDCFLVMWTIYRWLPRWRLLDAASLSVVSSICNPLRPALTKTVSKLSAMSSIIVASFFLLSDRADAAQYISGDFFHHFPIRHFYFFGPESLCQRLGVQLM